MPSSNGEHVPTSSSPLHNTMATGSSPSIGTGHSRQRSLSQRTFAEEDPIFAATSPRMGYAAHFGHQNVYMAAPDSRGRFDSPRSSINSISYSSSGHAFAGAGVNPFRDSAPSLASSALQAKYGLLNEGAKFYDLGGPGQVGEADDKLHDPGPKAPRTGYSHYIHETSAFRGKGLGAMGLLNVVSVILLMCGIVFLFAGWPVMNWAVQTFGYNTSMSYYDDAAVVSGAPNITNRAMIDPDTPTSAYTKMGSDGVEMQLVFSDEFNVDGRLFYPGMDPFWEAMDLHYWQTNDMEWYEPDNVGTKDGYLYLELTKETKANSHGTGYLGGMLQSWNKFCWTGGRIEVKLSLPGDTQVQGLWPAVWMMGNLGRAGYGATLEGMWPYVYDFCDAGTLPNQTNPETGLPAFTKAQGDQYHDGSLSYLTGQRLSRCTCPGEDHPGPKDGKEFVGRGAPEIDIFEALVTADGVGNISQSAQWAPFNAHYYLTHNESAQYAEYYTSEYETAANEYLGGVYQQVTSGLSRTIPESYNKTDLDSFAMYGTEYVPTDRNGYGTGHIYWLQEEENMWYMSDQAMAADPTIDVSNRTVTGEPLYTILNLGMSTSFTDVDVDGLTFPATMRVDYIRVYQDPDNINIGCSPKDYPTADYIEKHAEAYHNPNLTTWADYSNTSPKNRLVDTC
ncbi:hypothetical protein JCM11641_006283 [Rhodosporidiobolus odoratus]